MNKSFYSKLVPILVIVLVCVLIVQFFNVNINDHNGFRFYNMPTLYEGMKGKTQKNVINPLNA